MDSADTDAQAVAAMSRNMLAAIEKQRVLESSHAEDVLTDQGEVDLQVFCREFEKKHGIGRRDEFGPWMSAPTITQQDRDNLDASMYRIRNANKAPSFRP